MKVLLVSSSSGSHGGGEFYLRELAASLQSLGHEVMTWASDHPQMNALSDSFQTRGLSIRRFHYVNTYHRRLRSLGAYCDWNLHRQLAQQFLQSGADIIHINQQCLEDALDLVFAAGVCGLPAVSTIHVTRSAASLGARMAHARDFLARRTLRRAGLPLIGISKTSAEDLSQFVNGSRVLDGPIAGSLRAGTCCPVYAVANGVSVPEGGKREYWRTSMGIKPDHIVMGVVARIEQQKNPLFMCRLLKALPEFVHCLWVGDGRLRSELEKEIVHQQLSGRFHLAGWQDDASAWMSAFDLFALGSLYEGLPLALLEAMAAGLPCVASRVDGTQDAINDGVDGFLCPVNDVDSWISTLQPLIASADFRSQISLAARLRYAADFSREAMAQRTAKVYEAVIGRFSVNRKQPMSNDQ